MGNSASNRSKAWPGTPVSTNDSFDQIVAGVDYLHSRISGERVQSAKLEMARQGSMPGGYGPGIVGYDNAGEGRRVINPEEARIVRRIFDEFDKGLSYHKIACGLNADGIPSKRGGNWGVAVIRNILGNLSYIGIDYYGKTRTVWSDERVPVKVDVPRDEWVEIRGLTPALIDVELFARVQRKMGKEVDCRWFIASRS